MGEALNTKPRPIRQVSFDDFARVAYTYPGTECNECAHGKVTQEFEADERRGCSVRAKRPCSDPLRSTASFALLSRATVYMLSMSLL